MYSGTATSKSTLTYIEAELGLLNCKQSKKMSNSKYMDVFRNRAEVYVLLGGEPGTYESRINAVLAADALDIDNVTEAERATAHAIAREEYLAVLFINNCDQSKFGKRVIDLKVRHVESNDDNSGGPYPSTLAKALEMLETWDEAHKRSKRNRPTYDESGGIAFATTDDDHSSNRNGQGNGGRGRGGRNAGRGRNGGRTGRGGRGRHNDARDSYARDDTHNIQDVDEDDDGIFEHGDTNSGNNNANVNNYSDCHNISPAQRLKLTRSTLIIDSASSVDIIGDESLIHDVHDAPKPLKVRTVNGCTTISKMAFLGTYPLPVWYHPSGKVNILSLHNMQKFYRCTMDTEKSNTINIHMADGNIMKFKATDINRLYTFQLPKHTSIKHLLCLFATAPEASSFTCFNIDTVAARSDKYTKRQIKNAIKARELENIVMRPGNKKFTDVCLPHFKDECPVNKADVKAANNIFGKNLGSLKGKTVHSKQSHVQTNIQPVPPEILKLHKQVTIAIDLMFVNNIPFLVTISRRLRFGTVDALPNRQLKTVQQKLQSVVNMYTHRGFTISSILADGEFEPLRPWFPFLNTCSENEHVPDIERFIRTIKDSTRSAYRMLPFTRIPRMLVIHLVINSVFWFNAFPSTDGVSSKHSPRRLLVGYEVSYSKHAVLKFGSYVQTHEEHTNDMSQRTAGAICLGPTGNQQGGHWFMSLTSGSRIRRNHWTPMPMPSDVITRVNAIGSRQKMPTKLTYANRYGHEIEDTLNELDYDSSDDDSDYSSDQDSDDSDSDTDGSLDDDTSTSSSSDSEDDDDDDSDDDAVEITEENRSEDGIIDPANEINVPRAPPAMNPIPAIERQQEQQPPQRVQQPQTRMVDRPRVRFNNDHANDGQQRQPALVDNPTPIGETTGVD